MSQEHANSTNHSTPIGSNVELPDAEGLTMHELGDSVDFTQAMDKYAVRVMPTPSWNFWQQVAAPVANQFADEFSMMDEAERKAFMSKTYNESFTRVHGKDWRRKRKMEFGTDALKILSESIKGPPPPPQVTGICHDGPTELVPSVTVVASLHLYILYD